MTDACPFCLIVAGDAPVNLVAQWPNVWAIRPLNPVVDGHILFIPNVHVADFTEDPAISSSVMFRAAQWAQAFGGDANLITSKGEAVTQTVFHAHLHYVPRVAGDGLLLPWSPKVGAA
jgi:histidine triad (HIT) family protein